MSEQELAAACPLYVQMQAAANSFVELKLLIASIEKAICEMKEAFGQQLKAINEAIQSLAERCPPQLPPKKRTRAARKKAPAPQPIVAEKRILLAEEEEEERSVF